MTTFRTSKSTQAVQAELASLILGMNSQADVATGQVLRDLSIDVPGIEMAYLFVLLDYVNAVKSLDGIVALPSDASFVELIRQSLGFDTSTDVTNMVSSDLDALASNWGLVRQTAVAARYKQRFYRASNPGGTVQVPAGTTVQTRDGGVQFRINASTPQSLQTDSVLGLYYVEETSEAVVAGTGGNVALGAINTIAPSISGFTSTANVEIIESGTDNESDATFASRVKEVFKQNGIDTVGGYRALMLTAPVNAQDALVVKPGDALMYRFPAGAVDIYLVGKNLVTAREAIVYHAGTTTYLLGHQPVESIQSVNDGAIAGANYSLVKDTTSNWRLSPKAQDSIFFSNVTGLVDGTSFTVQYTYDKRVNDGQNVVSVSDDTAVPAADVLVRQGTQVLIGVDAEVVIFGQRAISDVQADILADFGKFLDGGTATTGALYPAKRLGEHVDFSDIVDVFTAVNDVDRVTITTLVVRKDGVAQAVDPVPVAANEYARAGVVTFL